MRVARKLALEIALLIAGACVGGVPMLLCLLAAGLGVFVHWWCGELHLAWRCPRLDRLGLKIASRSAPWETLAAADAALRTLDNDLGRFREFFPDARRDLINAAARALEAQRLLNRAEAALRHAPYGEARDLLEAQRTKSLREIAGLTEKLRELCARFIASTQPLHATLDPSPDLQALESRSEILSRELVS